MNKKILISVTCLLGLITFSPASQAATSSGGSRSNSKIGLAVGFITEPFPSVVGYNLSYNFSPHFRGTIGYGTVSIDQPSYQVNIQTFSFEMKGFLLAWTFTPFVSGGYSIVTGTVSGTGSTSGLSITAAQSAPFLGFGLDWQSHIGFNFGVEYKIGFMSPQNLGAPGAYIGWYF